VYNQCVPLIRRNIIVDEKQWEALKQLPALDIDSRDSASLHVRRAIREYLERLAKKNSKRSLKS
jgi:hypothetical protein